MFSPERILYYRTLNLLHILVLGATVVIMTTLVVASVYMFVKGTSFKQTAEFSSPSSNIALPANETEFQDVTIVQRLQNQIDELRANQENVLSDLRQESNNIINKFNGWLGFWTAILAIFGGIIPIVLQYILREKSKKEMEEMFECLQTRALDHQMQLLVSSIEYDHECSIISDSVEKKDYITMLTAETNKYMRELIGVLDNKQGFLSREAEMHIIIGLIQYCRLIDIFKINATRAHYKQLEVLLTKIKALIVEILKHKDYTRTYVWNCLMDLLPQLYSLANFEIDD